MSFRGFAARVFRYTLRTYEWASGRRHYPWSSGPPQRFFALVANRASGLPGAYFRALYALAAGLLKFRERLFADRVNFAARLCAPVNAETLRNAALWQREVVGRQSMAKAHANIRVRDADRVQVDRLVSVLLMPGRLRNINIFFDDAAVLAARTSTFTVAEEGRSLHGAFDLNAPRAVATEDLESPDWQSVLSGRTGLESNVNYYLKLAHLGSFVVAVSLPETDDGFCDASLPEWSAALQSLEWPRPVSFVILNPISPHAVHVQSAGQRHSPAFARQAGLSWAETVRLAQRADAFVGPLDAFGLAARTARRPGVYLGAGPQESFDSANGVVHASGLSPAEACKHLAAILAQPPERARQTQSARPSMRKESMGANFTLLIPTYNRPQLLERLLRYLQRTQASFSILALDSSAPDMRAQNKAAIAAIDLDIRHAVFDPAIDPYAKMREGLKMVGTPYCSLCADDDLVLVAAVERCVAELERDRKASLAHGYYFNFKEQESFDLSSVVYRRRSVDNPRPLARLRSLFAAYEALLYGVFRTEAAARAFRDVDRMNAVLGKELLTGALSVISGKALRISDFYYGRNTAESLAYSAWHPHQILAHEPGQLFAEYPMFRDLVLQALAEADPGVAGTPCAKVVDLIFLRYLEPFLRHDVLDLMLDMSMGGEAPSALVTKVWDTFVRAPRPSPPVEPLLDAHSAFSPSRVGSGRPRDYEWGGAAWDGEERKYKVFYEFLFPEMQPDVLVGKDKLVSLLQSLNAY